MSSETLAQLELIDKLRGLGISNFVALPQVSHRLPKSMDVPAN